jgi:hypothetical protein
MKKILAPFVMLLVAAAIVYSIKLNGFDIVNALGTAMIIIAMVITYRILMAKPKKRNEFS